MKNLFIIEESERERILGMHENATKNQYLTENEEMSEQVGAGIKSKFAGLGARVKTTAQNLRTAVTPTTAQERITDSPKLNAALARIKSRAASFNKIVTDLNTDLDEIVKNATPFTDANNPFRFEAQQLLDLTNTYRTLLTQVNNTNNQMASFKFQKPELTAPSSTTPAPAAAPASTTPAPASSTTTTT
jgi:ABC-type transporter Mla subunit MlaD